jgi:hypothetical protein
MKQSSAKNSSLSIRNPNAATKPIAIAQANSNPSASSVLEETSKLIS